MDSLNNKAISLCACGCNQPVTINRAGNPNQYLRGHFLRGKPKSEDQRQKLSAAMIGKPGPWKGKTIPEAARQKMSAAKKGRPLKPEHRQKISEAMVGKPHPAIHHKQTTATKLKKRLAQLGDKGSGWKGGISTDNQRARASAALRDWRAAVFKRDNYTCQKCGARHLKSVRPVLQSHHLKPFSTHHDLRFEVSNGLTVCKPCHKEIHRRKP